MAPKEVRDDLPGAYRDAAQRMRDVCEDAAAQVQNAMSATPGWQAAAKAAAAHAVLIASECETEVLVTKLLRAHMEAGDRSPEKVAEQVRQKFLSSLAAPGLGFFETASPETASLAPVALKHAAAFESWRESLALDVPERFRRVLDGEERDVRRAGSPPARSRRRERQVVFGFLLVTAAMSLCGLSWLDVLRKALTLL